jgi:hypothetical protein
MPGGPGGQLPVGPAPVPAAMPGQAAPAPKKRRRWVGLVILAVIVVGVFGSALYFTRNAPKGAKVGDCVHQNGTDSVEIIACNDPNATYKVVGRVENQTQIDAGISSCDAFDNATQVFWEGQDGGTGYVLCLAANH